MNTLGKRLKHFRTEVLDLTQKELAQRIGYTHSYISEIEKGRRPQPHDRFLNNLSIAFGLNVNWLLTGEGSMRNEVQPTDMEKLEAIMSGKSETKKNFIRALADMPEALLDEMLPYLRKAVAEKEKL